ncbi:MAG: adenylyl-sulfate kinase [Rubrivivax sp.]|nr:adenylyl-sulfate kinase [Rubrivivax sp.]
MAVPPDGTARPAAGLLRFITCGSVDDGKSTLIGRLLHDCGALPDDQLAALLSAAQREGGPQAAPDLARLLDGLAAEREQGITIDVAYRHFATARRRFIVADTPGHAQYTRNMVTGASTADAAVILVDARKGVLTQTRRHSCVVQLIGIRQVLLAVTKMDLVGFDEAVFRGIETDYRAFAGQLGLDEIVALPVSGLTGDNVAQGSAHLPWHQGPSLLQALEDCEPVETRLQQQPFRMPVQWVNRPHADFRGYCGLVAAGQLRPGDRVRVQPSGRETTVARIVAFEGDRPLAVAGESVTLTLHDDVDITRGDVLSAAAAPVEVADQFEARVVWMDDEPLLPGRRYLLQLGTRTVNASIGEIKHRLDVDTLAPLAARTLALNDIGLCTLLLDRPMPFEPYAVNRDLGGFILVDRVSHRTVGAGMLNFALRRAHNVHLQAMDVDKGARAALLGQKPVLLWFTGLSGAGKSSIANAVAGRLHAQGRLCFVLDGDNLRHGLNRDLGFTDADRVENIRRVAEVARLMVDAGLIVIVSLISPFRREREMARSLLAPDEFIEVHVDVPLAVAEARDAKGLYAKARRGELPHFTGIDSPYEAPESPELRLPADRLTVAQAAESVLTLLAARGMAGADA